MKRVTFITSTIAALWVTIVLVFVMAREHAEAATRTTPMNIAAVVGARCSIAVSPLNFSTDYRAGQAAPVDSAATVVVNCDAGRKVAIKMGQGLYPAPGSTDNNPLRRMSNGTSYLNYNLFEDAARTQVWDNRSNAVKTTRVFPYSVIVYGRIFGSQDVEPGAYSDTVVATVHY